MPTAAWPGTTTTRRFRASFCCARARNRCRPCTTSKAKIDELNQPGHLLPGVQIEPYYDRTDLIDLTTETVHENLLVGMCLVSIILLMFLSNVRVALIVAINIPLALLFAFAVLFLRGKSANLLSIGAVDFGIIVDSSVIMVENIYRHLTHGEHADLPLKQRDRQACAEVERSLFFSTLIMVCALLPLFTMKGPEGQIFGPMADTYAFALGGALLLALTLSPVLVLLFLSNLKPARDNFLVRWLEAFYLRQLTLLLKLRWVALAGFCALVVVDRLGRLPDGPRVHAGAGGRQPLDSRHLPDQHLVRGSGGAQSRSAARFFAPVPGGRRRSCR